MYRYTDLSSGDDSSNSDNEAEVPEDLDEKVALESCFSYWFKFRMPITKLCDVAAYFTLCMKEMESLSVKNERQSEDIKPADSSALPISSKKEPLVQATLSSMFKKAEEKKVRMQNHLHSNVPCDFPFILTVRSWELICIRHK